METAEVLAKDARESLRSTKEPHEVGSGMPTDLLNAVSALARARARHVQPV